MISQVERHNVSHLLVRYAITQSFDDFSLIVAGGPQSVGGEFRCFSASRLFCSSMGPVSGGEIS